MPNGAKQAITKQISVCSLILITKEEDQNYNREYSEVINQSLSIKTPCSKELTCSGVVVPFGKKNNQNVCQKQYFNYVASWFLIGLCFFR